MEFRILGPLEIRQNGRPLPCKGTKQRLLLATLLLHANEVVSSDRLIDALWGEAPPPTANKALQATAARLGLRLVGWVGHSSFTFPRHGQAAVPELIRSAALRGGTARASP